MAEDSRPVALVTGGSGAIGAALLRRFGYRGYRTVGLDLEEALPDPSDPRTRGADDWVAADVTDSEATADAVEVVVDRHGRLDVVVNNAGITALGSLTDTTPDVFRRVMDVNLHGAVHVTRSALPALTRAGGRVVVMSSVAGFAPVLGRPAYVASKHAVTGLFESLRPELEQAGVGVTLVHPTFVRTPLRDANRDVRADESDRSTTGETLTPDGVADRAVAAVERGEDRVLIGRTARLAYHLHRLAPGTYERVMARRLG